jgi:serine/threonine-protein kinase
LAVFKYGSLLLALAATAGLSALATMRVVLTSQEVTVPSLIDKRIPEAGGLVERQGLNLRVEGRRNDPRVAEGRICAQDPAPGGQLKTQRGVKVWLSLGPQRLEVPDVAGQSLRTARIALEQARVPLGRVALVPSPEAEGTILLQQPGAGKVEELAAEGLALLVSEGPAGPQFVMPDLIGGDAGRAVDLLTNAGLRVGELRQRSYPGVSAGIVLRQVPPAGYRVAARSPVTLDVSKAP